MSGEKKLEIERFEHVLSGVVEEIAKEDFREFKPHAKVGRGESWYQRGIEVSSSPLSFPSFSLVPLA